MLGQGTSFIGAMLTAVAVPVQVYALSHSSLQVGLVGLVGLVPLVVFGLYGGAIADVDRPPHAVAGQLAGHLGVHRRAAAADPGRPAPACR